VRLSIPAWRKFTLSFALLTFSAHAQDGIAEVQSPATIVVLAAERASEPELPQAPSQTKAEQEKEVEKKEQSKRVLGVVPMFGTTDRMDAPPLKSGEKFRLFARSAFDPVTIVIAAAQAGVSQADNEFPTYGQGAAGYGKRFGTAFSDQVSAGFFSNFLYPTVFKHDPRYFRKAHGSFTRRFTYSLLQELVCHTDKGGRAFNASIILGAFSSGALSNVYYPSRDRGLGLTMNRAGLALAYSAAGNMFNEFWPDIHRKLFHKEEPKPPAESQPAPTKPQ
jgi:hypothetical protein